MHERPLEATSPFVFLVGAGGRRRCEPISYDALVRLFSRRMSALGLRTPETTPLLIFFREASQWGWDDVPSRPLLGRFDLPKLPARLPRFIPRDELDRLMKAIEGLENPYQRTALLLVRWSGARKGEIRRLTIDCLDTYPDGYPRLRIPVGKTCTERMIPLHPEPDRRRLLSAVIRIWLWLKQREGNVSIFSGWSCGCAVATRAMPGDGR
jgi:integrase